MDLKNKLRDWSQEKAEGRTRGPYHHGLKCRVGRHRSVSEAILLERALTADGFNVVLQHMDCCEDSQRHPCGCPHACMEIGRQVSEPQLTMFKEAWRQDGEAAMAMAVRIWKALP